MNFKDIDYHKEASEAYKEGKYFNEAKEWYFEKYLSQYKSRSVFIIISIFCGLVFLITSNVFLKGILAVKNYSGVLQIDRKTESKGVLRMEKLPHHYLNTNKIIAEFFVRRFVEVIEGYSNETGSLMELNRHYEASLKYISGTALDDYKERFESVMTPEFLQGYSRQVSLKYCNFISNSVGFWTNFKTYFTPSKIGEVMSCGLDVKFIKDGRVVDVKSFENLITFSFEPIHRLKDGKKSQVNFLVTDYKIVLADD
jgi:hypothetical protein